MTVISVLCPTRERPVALEATTVGLLELAADPHEIEILVAADPDDRSPLSLPWQASVWTAPERYGYAHLEEYYNHLAGMAKGDWLFVWNDDATMETPGWDAIVRGQAPAMLWAKPCNPEAEPWMPSEFPVIPAAWYRHWGHLSLHHSVDMWLGRVGLATGTGVHIPVTIDHCVAYERSTAGYPSFHTTLMEQERERDATRLRQLLDAERGAYDMAPGQ